MNNSKEARNFSTNAFWRIYKASENLSVVCNISQVKLEKTQLEIEWTFSTFFSDNELVKEFGGRLLNNLHSPAEYSGTVAKMHLT